jgi:mannose/fructose/N-acetylgalactosamine-specific phosphotransferase system component IIC
VNPLIEKFKGYLSGTAFLVVFVGISWHTWFRSDSWWHLRAGKEILAGEFSYREHWSYLAEGRFWPNHEWLYQCFLYGQWWLSEKLFDAGYFIPILAAAAGMTLALYLMQPSLKTKKREELDYRIILPLSLLVFGLLMIKGIDGSVIRPQSFTFLFFAGLCWLLRNEKYKYIPLVMLVWANFHAAFLYGFALLFAALVANVYFWLKGDRSDLTILKKFLPYASAGVLLTLVNPLGFELWKHTMKSKEEYLDYGVIEWQAIFWFPFYLQWVIPLVIILLLVLYFRRDRIKEYSDVFDLLVAAGCLILGIAAIRNIPVILLGFLPLFILCLSPKGESIRYPTKKSLYSFAALGTIIALVFSIGGVESRKEKIQVSPLTKSDLIFIEDCVNRRGNLFTEYNSGGDIIWWIPSVKIFLDNRYDPYSKKMLGYNGLNMRARYEPVFEKYNIKCLAIRKPTPVVPRIFDRDGWTQYPSENWWIYEAPK